MTLPSKRMAAGMVVLALCACATPEGGMPRSALDHSINECVAAVALGAIIGAVADKNRGQGALIGAGIGGVACGVLIAINNERDKQRIREAQFAALNANTSGTEQFVGDDGRTRTVRTVVRDVPTPPAIAALPPPMTMPDGGETDGVMPVSVMTSPDMFVGPCRAAQSQIAVQGQTADLPSEMFCRTANDSAKGDNCPSLEFPTEVAVVAPPKTENGNLPAPGAPKDITFSPGKITIDLSPKIHSFTPSQSPGVLRRAP